MVFCCAVKHSKNTETNRTETIPTNTNTVHGAIYTRNTGVQCMLLSVLVVCSL